MNCHGEIVKKGVPARHREPARSGEAGGPEEGRFRIADFRMRIESFLAAS
jgi:hypothetical protein